MQDLISSLEVSPEDWALRCTLCQSLRENGRPDEAAAIMSSAPEIPGDEESILFAASILGEGNPAVGVALMDQFAAIQETTEALRACRAVLVEKMTSAERASTGDSASDRSGPETAGREDLPSGEAVKIFVIGPGVAVSAAERAPLTNDKFGAIGIAVLAHVVLFIF